MKNLKPSRIFTLLLLTLVVAVLGMLSKSEKGGLGKAPSRTLVPSALADNPGGSANESCSVESSCGSAECGSGTGGAEAAESSSSSCESN